MNDAHLRLAVTGLKGQVVSALIERAPKDVEIIALGRPQLELSKPEAVIASLRHVGCDAIINAAAYTQVDKAESERDLAISVNGSGAGIVAQAAAALNVPLLHLSTDYVFDGLLGRPYLEDDQTNPASVYGLSKLIGEGKIRQAHANHVILRTAWVYSPFGSNFVKTMLQLAAERDEVHVVTDQIGNPTDALEIADALIHIARRLKVEPSASLRGTFHFTGEGEASWADMAEAIFDRLHEIKGKSVKVRRIMTQDYPTAAKRPANSRLNNRKLEQIYSLNRTQWQTSLRSCVERLL